MMTRISQLLAILILTIGGLNAQTEQIQNQSAGVNKNTTVQGSVKNQGNGNNQHITICHQTGNGGSHTITVSVNALQAHLNHGDYIGACTTGNENGDDDNNDDGEDDGNDDGNNGNEDGEDDGNDDGNNGNDDGDDDGNDDGNNGNDDGEDDGNDDGNNGNDDGEDDGNDDGNDDGDDDDQTNTGGDTTVVEQPSPAGCNAVEVMSYIPGTTNDLLTPIEASRQNLINALGSPENSDVATPSSSYNFVSLGFGGEITLKFANPIHNGDGDDIYVVETTFGNNAQNCNRYPEKIRAFASQNNCDWVFLGEGCQNTYFDLQGLAWAQYVKLIDISRIDFPYGGLADGYDLDGIVCLNGEEANPVASAVSNEYAIEAYDYFPGTMKNSGVIPAARSNKDNAVGAPQYSDVVNFVSLGFGGKVSLKLGYVVFNKPGADLMLVETSFGNPTCDNYPETARIEVSLDNSTWYMLSESFCLDQSIDIDGSGTEMFQYVRITDASAMSNAHFPGTADGFDVDGIVVAQPGCSSTSAARIAHVQTQDNTTTANEVDEISVYPNPFNETLSVNLSTSNTSETFEVSVINTLGQVMSRENVEVSSSSNIRHMLPASTLAKGTYLISVRSTNTNEVIRTIKF